MSDFAQRLSEQFLEMRWRCLSLAADMDRLQRSDHAKGEMGSSQQLSDLRAALRIVMDSEPNRAERVQMLFSDQTREIGK
jgi:hypothetical protein